MSEQKQTHPDPSEGSVWKRRPIATFGTVSLLATAALLAPQVGGEINKTAQERSAAAKAHEAFEQVTGSDIYNCNLESASVIRDQEDNETVVLGIRKEQTDASKIDFYLRDGGTRVGDRQFEIMWFPSSASVAIDRAPVFTEYSLDTDDGAVQEFAVPASIFLGAVQDASSAIPYYDNPHVSQEGVRNVGVEFGAILNDSKDASTLEEPRFLTVDCGSIEYHTDANGHLQVQVPERP